MIFDTDMHTDEMYTPEVEWGLNVSFCVRWVAKKKNENLDFRPNRMSVSVKLYTVL